MLPQFAQAVRSRIASAGSYNLTYSAAPIRSMRRTDTRWRPTSAHHRTDHACITDEQVQAQVNHSSTTKRRKQRPAQPVVRVPSSERRRVHHRGRVGQRVRRVSLAERPAARPDVYAWSIDPIIEIGAVAPGQDPQGNPDAETSADIAAHETIEAMTDPEGIGWMDPNGFEVGDKCEFGPQLRDAARLRQRRVAVQPGDQRPPVPDPGDVVQRRRRLRPAHD